MILSFKELKETKNMKIEVPEGNDHRLESTGALSCRSLTYLENVLLTKSNEVRLNKAKCWWQKVLATLVSIKSTEHETTSYNKERVPSGSR